MNISQIVSQLIAVAKADAAKTILPLLAAFFTSIATNPTAINVTAQVAKLQVDLIAALPSIELDVLKQLASILNAEAQALLSPSTPA